MAPLITKFHPPGPGGALLPLGLRSNTQCTLHPLISFSNPPQVLEEHSSFLADISSSIPGIDEAMSFAEVMKQARAAGGQRGGRRNAAERSAAQSRAAGCGRGHEAGKLRDAVYSLAEGGAGWLRGAGGACKG